MAHNNWLTDVQSALQSTENTCSNRTLLFLWFRKRGPTWNCLKLNVPSIMLSTSIPSFSLVRRSRVRIASRERCKTYQIHAYIIRNILGRKLYVKIYIRLPVCFGEETLSLFPVCDRILSTRLETASSLDRKPDQILSLSESWHKLTYPCTNT